MLKFLQVPKYRQLESPIRSQSISETNLNSLHVFASNLIEMSLMFRLEAIFNFRSWIALLKFLKASSVSSGELRIITSVRLVNAPHIFYILTYFFSYKILTVIIKKLKVTLRCWSFSFGKLLSFMYFILAQCEAKNWVPVGVILWQADKSMKNKFRRPSFIGR